LGNLHIGQGKRGKKKRKPRPSLPQNRSQPARDHGWTPAVHGTHGYESEAANPGHNGAGVSGPRGILSAQGRDCIEDDCCRQHANGRIATRLRQFSRVLAHSWHSSSVGATDDWDRTCADALTRRVLKNPGQRLNGNTVSTGGPRLDQFPPT